MRICISIDSERQTDILIDITPISTIKQIKEEICRRRKIQLNKCTMRFIYAGKTLEDDKTFAFYNIKDSATGYLMVTSSSPSPNDKETLNLVHKKIVADAVAQYLKSQSIPKNINQQLQELYNALNEKNDNDFRTFIKEFAKSNLGNKFIVWLQLLTLKHEDFFPNSMHGDHFITIDPIKFNLEEYIDSLLPKPPVKYLKGVRSKSVSSLIKMAKNMQSKPISILQEIRRYDFFAPTMQFSYDKKISNVSQLRKLIPNNKNSIIKITAKNKMVFVKTVMIHGKVMFIGDIHGHFPTLVEIAKPLENFLQSGGTVVFLGDLIDMRDPEKEDQSIAVVLFVSMLHIKYGNKALWTRGNHGFEEIYTTYGHGWLEKFSKPEQQREVMKSFNIIFDKPPFTGFHFFKGSLGGWSAYSFSHGAPMYIFPNKTRSLTAVAAGGFIDQDTGEFTKNKIGKSDIEKKIIANNCTWNDKAGTGRFELEGDITSRNDGIMIGAKTKEAYKKMGIERHFFGHRHKNEQYYEGFYRTISTGLFKRYMNKDSQQVVLVAANGSFKYFYVRDLGKAITFKPSPKDNPFSFTQYLIETGKIDDFAQKYYTLKKPWIELSIMQQRDCLNRFIQHVSHNKVTGAEIGKELEKNYIIWQKRKKSITKFVLKYKIIILADLKKYKFSDEKYLALFHEYIKEKQNVDNFCQSIQHGDKNMIARQCRYGFASWVTKK